MGLEMRHCRRRYLPDHDHVQPLASCFYNSQESCGSFVGCLSESFSADCHRAKYDSRNDLCLASTHSIAIDSPPSVFLVQSGVASCSSPLLPFFGFGAVLTSYLSISHLSLCEWPDIRLWAQTRCRLCGSSATTPSSTPSGMPGSTPDSTPRSTPVHTELIGGWHENQLMDYSALLD